MNTAEKVQLTLDVINGKQPLSTLRDHLDDSANFLRLAVDHCVGQALSQAAVNRTEFRFSLKEQGSTRLTPWRPEVSQFAASQAMGQLRQQHPQAEIAIERRY